MTREEQDLEDEEAWARSFRDKPEVLQAMAREALEEHRRGETRLLWPHRAKNVTLTGQ
jgi:hypothetical protein